MKPVWIVDDDRSIRWVIEKALSREGIAFNSFSTAQEALAALSSGAPEVLVSDIRMPGQSGLELLQAVKTRHPAVPVIVMTAYSDLDSAVAAFQGGAYEYLPKPFDVDQAVELIRRALDESRREAEVVEPMGAETYVHLSIGGVSMVARVSAKDRLRVHQKVAVLMEMREAHFFDPGTDRAIL